ncbi:zf-HC2 domain-containing protein [Clostridium sp. CF012]|uniref:zf-HC2 domain-containing protein n=1 Tax=Clostridium sp. CF012 TaxID=2843319 RepID=UPI001C0E1643|nr:zf-HC2 domain-containing protein [Clostridium sp. CF012]MBU3146197.1 zf-HC2 domain-containing protein [Clostridium sp. CF012]
MSKVSCGIIKDLLPLYYDRVCSDESNKVVEEHLDECNNCKNELDRIGVDIKLPKETIEENRSNANAIKDIADSWNRSKIKAFTRGLIGATVIFTVLFLGYIGLFKWNIISVPTDVVKVSGVSLLADGRIAYHIESTDRFELRRVKYDMDGDGNFYQNPLRPIIKTEVKFNMTVNNNDFFDIKAQEMNSNGAEIKALYWGNPKDNILIWRKGMNLPKASEKVEAELNVSPGQVRVQP